MAVYTTFEPININQDIKKNGKIVFRDEQKDAIKKALKHFKKRDKQQQFLWNAKMRFGKTLSALELARQMGVKRTLIVTHRPVVNASWAEDFGKIFIKNKEHYKYGTKFDNDSFGNFYELERFVKNEDNHYIFFASMQYLRRSNMVGGDNDEQLKKDILNTEWDLVVIDEAHEGTRTSLGQEVIGVLYKENTKMLHLSGTPFNLYDNFQDDEIFTWDYIQEQKAKRDWNIKNPNIPNPYAELPHMNIYTYDLARLVGSNFVGENATFQFKEFFRTWTGNPKIDKAEMPVGGKGRFIHEKEVLDFLDLMCKEDDKSNYPFSKQEYQENFNHTMWVVPGVKEAKALAQLLEQHEIFSAFKIVNVAGNNEDDECKEDALERVKQAIGSVPRDTLTITISCGRLTTGVTVPAWTAVIYLKGSENTSAATYMQTIFRVQSPDTKSHPSKIKTECHVFDFAPDRSLKMMAETAKFASLTQKERSSANLNSREDDINQMEEFLSFCPVISLDGGKMVSYNAEKLFAQLESVYIDRVVRNGFNDYSLYDTKYLLQLNGEEVDELNDLGRLIAETTNMQKPSTAKNISVSDSGGNLNGTKSSRTTSKNGSGDEVLSEEDKAAKEEERKRKEEIRKEKENRVSILRGISLRIPLLIFGAEVDDESEGITIDNFTRKIDDASWEEFMPRGVTKELFNKFKKCYNPVIFTSAGKRIRFLAREADKMHPNDRIQRITEIFSYFHNPDKETVLTPWRVVNMHMSDCLGGYCFFNEKFDGANQKTITDDHGNEEVVDTNQPRFVDRGEVTKDVFKSDSKILEINSKTGLYPLYMTYSLYRMRELDFEEHELIDEYSVEEEQVVWDDIIKNNIYVICNTPMAARITRRTLLGFREVESINIKNIELVKRVAEDKDSLVKDLKSVSFWNDAEKNKEEMKFNAIVGNPPYNIIDGGSGNGNGAFPIFQKFVLLAQEIRPSFISMIMPARWFAGGRGLDDFRQSMLNDKRLEYLYDHIDSRELFPTVNIAGGICYFLWNIDYKGKCKMTSYLGGNVEFKERTLNEYDIFVRDNIGVDIVRKVLSKESQFFNTKVYSRNPFGFASSVRGEAKPFKDCLTLISSGGIGYVAPKSVTQNLSIAQKFKVSIGKVVPCNGEVGVDPRKGYKGITASRVLNRGEIITDTYLLLDVYDTENEAFNCAGYFKLKFIRFLLRLTFSSMNISKDNFKFIPVLDFNKSWSDHELYDRYSLTTQEREYVEKLIRPID